MLLDDKKISILMPAHEEGHHIYENVLEVAATFDNFLLKYEIVVVDDGSEDDTFEEALKVQRELGASRVKVIQNPINHGKGFALKAGFEKTSGDYILFLDADLDIHPRQVGRFFQIMNAGDCDVVIASKRHPQSHLVYPLTRKVLSNFYYLMTRIIFGLPVKDTQTGLALFKREVLEKVFPRIVVKKYAFSLEVLVLAHEFGYKIKEAPVDIDFKKNFGHIDPRDIRNIFVDTLGIFYRLRIIKFYEKKQAGRVER